jgi:DNA-binding response OmpR family regulator
MYTGQKVLIIEDRRENIVFLANNILKPKGFEVITAMDGESGLRKALEENPDLIITDLNLPKMKGLEILADLQDRGAKIPTIVMTFQGSEEAAIKAFRLGAKDYLIKPFTIEDIEKALERIMISDKAIDSDTTTQTDLTALERKIVELENTVRLQQQKLQEQGSSPEISEHIQAQLAEQKKEVERWKQKYAEINELLTRQKVSTQEARGKARAMMQFIQFQQKEINRQQTEAIKLQKQVQALSESINKLLSRLKAQARQFPIPPRSTKKE